MGITEWLRTTIAENWPWLVLLWIVLRALSWWAQSVALANLSRRLERFERDEFLIVKSEAEARERNASLFRLLTEIDQKLSRTSRVLGQLVEKDQSGDGKRRLRVETDG